MFLPAHVSSFKEELANLISIFPRLQGKASISKFA